MELSVPGPWGSPAFPARYLVVAVHASVQQDVHHGFVPVPGRQVQRSVFLSVAAQKIGVSVQEHLHDLQPPVERGQVQRGLELVVAHGGVGQLLQKDLHHLGVAVLRRAVQRRLVVVVLGVRHTGASERGARSHPLLAQTIDV